MSRNSSIGSARELQGSLDPAEQLIFCTRTHGGVGGRTVSLAIEAVLVGRALALARG